MNTILHVIYIHVCIFMIKLMVHKNKIKNTGPCPILNKIHSETACLYTSCRHRISIACQCSPHSQAIFHYATIHKSVHCTFTSPYATTLFSALHTHWTVFLALNIEAQDLLGQFLQTGIPSLHTNDNYVHIHGTCNEDNLKPPKLNVYFQFLHCTSAKKPSECLQYTKTHRF